MLQLGDIVCIWNFPKTTFIRFVRRRTSARVSRQSRPIAFSSNAGVPLIAAIFPEAAAAAANSGKPLHRLDTHYVFCHLVAELALDAEPERRAMRNWQRRAVHVVGEDGLRMEGVFETDRFI